MNLEVLKCYKLLFNLQRLKENLGNYIILSIIIINIICVFTFLIKGYKTLSNIIKNIFQIKNNNQKIHNFQNITNNDNLLLLIYS